MIGVSMDQTTQSPYKLGSLFRAVFTLMMTLYAVALVCYLVLRVLFGDRFWWLSLANTFAHLLFLPLLFLIPAALLFRLRSSALRLVPLAIIGGMWFVPYYVPRSTDALTGTSLKVLTFNVWGNNHDLAQVENWLRAEDADVVLLQEISPTYATDRLPGLLDLYPYQEAQPDDTRSGGNITLSKYPILSIDYIDLGIRNTPWPLRMVIDVEGQAVAVYNIHLAWPGGYPRLPVPRRLDNLYVRVLLGFNDRLRNRQITQLLEHLKSETLPYIVGGDFNTSDSSATYSQIAAQMHDSFREAGFGFGGSWPVSSVRGLPSFVPPLIRIDYIWHSDQFTAIDARQGPPLGSDHLAVVATLLLNAP
jgi:vancomycin resistance protein VanJ